MIHYTAVSPFRDSTSGVSIALMFAGVPTQAFFANVAKARTVKTILQQCYGDKATVTDELVQYVSMAEANPSLQLAIASPPLGDARVFP